MNYKPKSTHYVIDITFPGNLVADSMARDWDECRIALINDGGIRTGLEQVGSAGNF